MAADYSSDRAYMADKQLPVSAELGSPPIGSESDPESLMSAMRIDMPGGYQGTCRERQGRDQAALIAVAIP
jgi:hypothetical protein